MYQEETKKRYPKEVWTAPSSSTHKPEVEMRIGMRIKKHALTPGHVSQLLLQLTIVNHAEHPRHPIMVMEAVLLVEIFFPFRSK